MTGAVFASKASGTMTVIINIAPHNASSTAAATPIFHRNFKKKESFEEVTPFEHAFSSSIFVYEVA